MKTSEGSVKGFFSTAGVMNAIFDAFVLKTDLVQADIFGWTVLDDMSFHVQQAACHTTNSLVSCLSRRLYSLGFSIESECHFPLSLERRLNPQKTVQLCTVAVAFQ